MVPKILQLTFERSIVRVELDSFFVANFCLLHSVETVEGGSLSRIAFGPRGLDFNRLYSVLYRFKWLVHFEERCRAVGEVDVVL